MGIKANDKERKILKEGGREREGGGGGDGEGA